MERMKMLFILFLIIVFLAGIYAIMNHKYPSKMESMETMENTENHDNNTNENCPDLLVQKGKVLVLYNTKQPIVDGKNPIPFFNLDEYIHYLEIQREKGINCPVLFLQQENNSQGQDVYRMRPSPFELQGGLPTMANINNQNIQHIQNAETNNMKVYEYKDASRDNPPYNTNQYNGFDPYGQDIGIYTEVDKIHDSTEMNKISDNPMDSNWAGITYTQQMVDSGKYVDNYISKPVLFQPKVAFNPTLPSSIPPPKDEL
jgi:spore cortex formation protein SpoVR/YcgB (stage V sporulation)